MAAITEAMVQEFKNNLELLVQQRGSRLRGAVRVETGIVGEVRYFEQLAPTAAVRKTTRNADTPLVKSDHRRRRVPMFDYEWADLVDTQDKLKLLIEPEGPYAVNASNALGRTMDDLIIEAANGNAATGKAGGVATALPAAQKVAVAGAGLNLAKLLKAKEILDANDAPESIEEQRYCLVTAEQITNLLNTTEIKNADYNSVRALVSGQIDTFLGFKFIRTQRLTTDASDDRLILCYVKSGLLLAIAQDLMTRIDERPDKSYATQVYAKMGIGSVRMEEDKVVQVACLEV